MRYAVLPFASVELYLTLFELHARAANAAHLCGPAGAVPILLISS